MNEDNVFVCKLILNGDRSAMYLKDYTLGNVHSRLYAVAMEVATGKNIERDYTLEDAVAASKAMITESFNTTELEAGEVRQIRAVGEYTYANAERVWNQNVYESEPGKNGLNEAIGVIAYPIPTIDNEKEIDWNYIPTHDKEGVTTNIAAMRYVFLYPGDSVWITDCYGKTVDSIR